jgi:tetratricopeptide (TPR) repeat protein
MKFITLFLLLIFYTSINAQFKITFDDYDIDREGNIVVTVFAQNLGNSQEIWAVYGYNFYDRFIEMQDNFFLQYEDILNDSKIRKRIPSSIVIKTIFGNYIAMETPTYYFSSTGLSSGQEWKITFTNIPQDAGSVSIIVLGSSIDLGDMPKADELRKRKDALLSDAINTAIEKSKTNQWNEAANYWEDAINLKSNIVYKHSETISISFCEKAKILFTQNNLSNAINYFEKAKRINESVFNKYRDDYSDLQFKYGAELLNNSNISNGVESLKYSYILSNRNRDKVENKFNEMKQSHFSSSFLSIIPGLSQLVIQKNSTKSLVLFGVFTISSLLTISNKIKADNYYDDYLRATTPQEAESQYYLADKQIKETALYFSLAVGTIIYSILDQYINTSDYNSMFEIDKNYSPKANLYSSGSFVISINIPL